MRCAGKWAGLVVVLFSALSGFCQSDNRSTKPVAGQAVPAVDSGHSNNSRQEWLEPGADPENRLVSPFLKHLIQDQEQFWTMPSRLKVQDLKWIAPFAGVTAAFIASD